MMERTINQNFKKLYEEPFYFDDRKIARTILLIKTLALIIDENTDALAQTEDITVLKAKELLFAKKVKFPEASINKFIDIPDFFSVAAYNKEWIRHIDDEKSSLHNLQELFKKYHLKVSSHEYCSGDRTQIISEMDNNYYCSYFLDLGLPNKYGDFNETIGNNLVQSVFDKTIRKIDKIVVYTQYPNALKNSMKDKVDLIIKGARSEQLAAVSKVATRIVKYIKSNFSYDIGNELLVLADSKISI